jgi:hypothetical protein
MRDVEAATVVLDVEAQFTVDVAQAHDGMRRLRILLHVLQRLEGRRVALLATGAAVRSPQWWTRHGSRRPNLCPLGATRGATQGGRR